MKRYVTTILWGIFALWIVAIFYIPYRLMSVGFLFWFTGFIVKFNLIIIPITLAMLVLLLCEGNLRRVKHHVKTLIVVVAILLATSFTFFRWVGLVNQFGYYGYYNTVDKYAKFNFEDLYEEMMPFEQETLEREATKLMYDLGFKQIWTYDALILMSTILLLQLIKRKEA